MAGDSRQTDRDDPDEDVSPATPYTAPFYGYQWGLAWPPVWRESDDDVDATGDDDATPSRRGAPADTASRDGSWWDEGLISLLLVAGVALVLFPEPATSGVGMLLIVAGVVAWLIDVAT